MNSKKMLQISGIQEGTVVDHIPTKSTFKVAEFLNLKEGKNIVTVGMNFESKKLGKKGVVKIGERFLTKGEVDKISLIAPDARISIIKDYEVKEKFSVEIPKILNGSISCANNNCITNNQSITTKFYVLSKDPLKIRCHYCERTLGKDDIEVA